MSRYRLAVKVTTGLGLLSLLALGATALKDIAHGGHNLRLEWNVLRILGSLLAVFIVAAIAAQRRTAKHNR